MPESKPPKKAGEPQTPNASGKGSQKPVKVKVKKPQTAGNPRWLVPTMLTLFIVGVLWVVTFYLTSGGARLPIPPLGQWNIAVGFALILVGFGLSTRWK